MNAPLLPPSPTRLGRGRSAVVWRDQDATGRLVARKVFQPDTAARAVFEVLSGAPNPYGWSRDAVCAALARRRILTRLVTFWFGDRLRLPATHGACWNHDERTWELVAELVRGRHVPLVGPRGLPSPDPLEDLTSGIMRPLQDRLEESGFDGLVWQAGRGNPVAASNFMLLPGRAFRWAWIDLESGVPALFALDPRAHAKFYAPKALRQRRPLFDDVDVARLRGYLAAHEEALVALHGELAQEELRHQVDLLEIHQTAWLGLNRLERGLLAAVAKGRITPEQAKGWRRRPAGWYAFTVERVAQSAVRRVAGLRHVAARAFQALRRGTWARGAFRFLTSQRYRALLSRRLVAGRIRLWRERGSLGPWEARGLLRDLRRDEVASYVTDFGVHLCVKPFVKTLQYVVLPLLYLLGVASGPATAFLLLAGGPIVRTAYTGGRLLQAWARGRRKPWIALGLGTLPVVGNSAYPVQFVASTFGRDGDLARFLLHESFALLGRRIPVWGGADTLTEHWMNRLPARVLRLGQAPRNVPVEVAAPESAITRALPPAMAGRGR